MSTAMYMYVRLTSAMTSVDSVVTGLGDLLGNCWDPRQPKPIQG